MSQLRHRGLSIILLLLTIGSARAAEKSAAVKLTAPGTFEVKINKDNVSVDANAAPVVSIFEEIGRQAGIAVESGIGTEEKITIQFIAVPLEEAIRKLAKNVSISYAQDAKDNKPRIARVVVLPEGKNSAPPMSRPASQASKPTELAPSSEPFKWEFDPGKLAEKAKSSKTK